MRVTGNGLGLWLLRKISFQWPFSRLPVCERYKAAVRQEILRAFRDRICRMQLRERGPSPFERDTDEQT